MYKNLKAHGRVPNRNRYVMRWKHSTDTTVMNMLTKAEKYAI